MALCRRARRGRKKGARSKENLALHIPNMLSRLVFVSGTYSVVVLYRFSQISLCFGHKFSRQKQKLSENVKLKGKVKAVD